MDRMFRFEKLQIWERACDVGSELCDLADDLDKKRFFRFAEQLRAAALSISNNIAEGSGSDSPAEFRSFLNYSRRSLFECASMVSFYHRKGHITAERRTTLLNDLDELSRMIHSFRSSL